MAWVKLYGSTLLVLLALDMIWLGFIAKNFYRTHLGFLMSEQIGWGAALLFYFVFAAAILFFTVSPALGRESLWFAILSGAFLGFVSYGAYDFTNLATISNWPLLLTVVDLVWGTMLTAGVSGFSFICARWLLTL